VREGAVGFCHLVGVFTLLDGRAALAASISSPERRSTMVVSLRLRAAAISQRMASA
jgi:hypothetical protein